MSAQTSDIILERLMSLHPKFVDLSLGRMERILAALGHPEQQIAPVVHVAGTNGKGSTLAMIRAGLEGAGHRCTAYTSPHLVRFHERIRLPEGLIAETHLSALLEECEAANGGDAITYFEITTAAAFLAFARAEADYTLLEVGLGGRLDATNVVDQPRLTVITPVSLDHQQFLGETVDKIAFEKAGILKPGVPGVIARQADPAMEVIEARAEEVGAPLIVSGRDFDAWMERGRLIYQDLTGLLDLPAPRLLGAHQVENAGVALAALRHLGIEETGCEHAMTHAEWPARFQHLVRGPLVEAAPRAELVLDGGHNPAAGETLAETLASQATRPTFIICGMLKTKDARGFLAPLAPLAQRLYAVSIPGETATLPATDTAQAARDTGHSTETADSVAEALAQIVAQEPAARVVICGSLYLAGQVLAENG
ncbi:MAG: folylpolyglutamate synthase/dihydrofolate synthase family protein [Pseudomonadota bacterium]